MTARKIDASETVGLIRVAGANDWYRLEPNSYGTFGATTATSPRNVIDDTGQRLKGPQTDLDASAAFQQDLTPVNFYPMVPGMMLMNRIKQPTSGDLFAATGSSPPTVTATGYDIGTGAAAAGFLAGHLIFAEGFTNGANNGLKVVTGTTGDEVEVAGLVAEGSPPANAVMRVVGVQFAADDIDVVNNGSEFPRLESTVFDFTTLQLAVGDVVFIGDDGTAFQFVNLHNNGLARVKSITAGALEFDKTQGGADRQTEMAAETTAGVTLRMWFCDISKNVAFSDSRFNKETYDIERQLGRKDPTGAPTEIQGETVTGNLLNVWTLNMPGQDKVTVDFEFLGRQKENHAGTVGDPLSSDGDNIIQFPRANAFNTTNSVAFQKFAEAPNDTDALAAPAALFDIPLDVTVTVSRNAQANKGVGILGAFDTTVGLFTPSIAANVYFTDVDALQKTVDNADVTYMQLLTSTFAGRTVGIVMDFPLGGASDDGVAVEASEPNTVSLTLEAARDPDIGHTMLYGEFWYLPPTLVETLRTASQA